MLIADSGSTQTDWVIINKEGQIKRYDTIGFNPYYVPAKEMSKILDKALVPFINTKGIEEIYYYGAGCSTSNKCFIVEEALENVFPNASIEVYHDLLGAARGLFNNKKGIACILGTGSNSCLYNGDKIIENVPSLGYLFGDEGSGAYIGKIFLTSYLRGNLPNTLKNSFENTFNYTLENILDSVYNQPLPNRYLGSFMGFIAENKKNKFIRTLVTSSFKKFFGEHVTKYTDYTKTDIGCVGSIAYYFRDILKNVASLYNVRLKKILPSPISGLIEFHKPPEE